MDLDKPGSRALELLETVFICIRELRDARDLDGSSGWLVGVGLAAGTASCSQQHAADDHTDASTTVVASTDVWGSVASAVAGDHATVKSIVNSAADDPHSYEATPADAAAIADASLVVYNGGGYDQWVDDVLAGHPGVTTVDAYSLLPGTVAQPANEHVFYDLTTAKAVAAQIADRLAKIDAAHADDYRANAAEFGERADEILQVRARDRPDPPRHGSGGDRARRALPAGQRRNRRQDPAGVQLARSRRTPTRACRSGRHARPDQHPPGVGAAVQPADARPPSPSRFRTPRSAPRVPVVTVTETLPHGHRLPDLAAPDRQTSWRAQLDNAPQTNR